MFRNHHAPSIRIEKDLGGVEPLAFAGRLWPVGPIGVDLACLQPGDEGVPVVIGSTGGRIDVDRPGWIGVIRMVEQQQFDPGRIPREDAEIDATGAECRPEGRRRPRSFEWMSHRSVHSHSHDKAWAGPVGGNGAGLVWRLAPGDAPADKDTGANRLTDSPSDSLKTVERWPGYPSAIVGSFLPRGPMSRLDCRPSNRRRCALCAGPGLSDRRSPSYSPVTS